MLGIMTAEQFEVCISRKNQAGRGVEAAFDVLVRGLTCAAAAELNGITKSRAYIAADTVKQRHIKIQAAYSKEK